MGITLEGGSLAAGERKSSEGTMKTRGRVLRGDCRSWESRNRVGDAEFGTRIQWTNNRPSRARSGRVKGAWLLSRCSIWMCATAGVEDARAAVFGG